MKKRLPPKHCRHIELLLNNYRHILVLPLSSKSLPPKKGKTVYRRKITAMTHYRDVCVRLTKRYRVNPCEH